MGSESASIPPVEENLDEHSVANLSSPLPVVNNDMVDDLTARIVRFRQRLGATATISLDEVDRATLVFASQLTSMLLEGRVAVTTDSAG